MIVMAFCSGSLLVPNIQHSRDVQSQMFDSLKIVYRILSHLAELVSTGLMGKHLNC